MYIETLIYIYIWLCICLIFFDVFCIFRKFYVDNHHKKNKGKLQKKVYEQLKKISNGKEIDKKHKRYLMKNLTKTNYLMEFHEMLMNFQNNYEKEINNYLISIRPVFTYLALEYKNKDSMKKAYFAYVTSKHNLSKGMVTDLIIDALISYMVEDSIYCRENVMRALYSFGDVQSVVRGIKMLDKHKVYYHNKLLTDGLLTFQGNHNDLSSALWENFNQFNIQIQISIINYFRLRTGDFSLELYGLLCDEKIQANIKYNIIRYFGKYQFAPAQDKLIEFLEITEKDKWEFSALAAFALSAYPSKVVVDVLKKALSHNNWYVRVNAAKSLVSMDIKCDNFSSVLNGNDHFAREMLQYHMKYDDRFREEQSLGEEVIVF